MWKKSKSKSEHARRFALAGESRTFGPLEPSVTYFELAMLVIHNVWHQNTIHEIGRVKDTVDRIEVKLNRLLAASTRFA